MRKTISLALVAAMLMATFMFVPTASAATLDANNVQIDAQYFGGEVIFDEVWGPQNKLMHASDVPEENRFDPEYMVYYGQVKEGNPELGTLTIDGIIEEGEWTDKVYHIDSDYAPDNASNTWSNNALFEVPSAENTFYYWLKADTKHGAAPADGLEYDVRFMWDEDYLYVAVEYMDKDFYVNKGQAGAFTSWDGDAIQFRVDPHGPNAIVGGTGYDASVDSIFPAPETLPEDDLTPDCSFPWHNEGVIYDNNGEEKHSVIGNFIFSYATNTTEIADNSKRYYPVEDALTGETIWTGATLMWKGDAGTDENLLDITTWAAVYPKSEQKIIDGKRQVVSNVVYEIALPWAAIGADLAPQYGDETELGFSMTRLNATNKDSNGNFNSYLSWGSGVTGFETKHMPQVCGGSNCLVLTDESYSEAVNCEHTFEAPTCINPETCSQCGYERGFVSGHKYTFSDESLPTGKNNGSISAVCTICGDSFTKTISSKEASVKYDFMEDETTLHDQGWVSGNGLTIQWETLDEEGNRYTDETDPEGTLREKIWVDSGELNADGTPKMIAKNAFDNTYFPGVAVADLRYSGQTGTYFDSNNYEISYTEAMDVYFTELNPHDPEDAGAYNTYFGQWFGGENGVSYYGGLFEVEGQFFFTILPSTYQKAETVEQFKAQALSYVPATAEQIALETWHEYVFMYDNNAEAAMVIWDGELVASASDYHFKTSRSDIQVIFLNHNTSCFVKNIEIGSTGLAAARSGWQGDVVVPSTFKATINGEVKEYAVGDTVEIATAAVFSSSGNTYRFVGWTGDTDVLADTSAKAHKTSFEMPAHDVTIEAKNIMVGDCDSKLDGKVNAVDSLTLKRVAAGIDNMPSAEHEIRFDIDGSGRINFTDSNLVSRIIASVWIPTATDSIYGPLYGN